LRGAVALGIHASHPFAIAGVHDSDLGAFVAATQAINALVGADGGPVI